MKLSKKHDKEWLGLVVTGEIYLRSIVSLLDECLKTSPKDKKEDYLKLRRQYLLIWKQVEHTNTRLQEEMESVFGGDESYHIYDTALINVRMNERGLSRSQQKKIAKQVGITTEAYITK